jgi:hypothetical protein
LCQKSGGLKQHHHHHLLLFVRIAVQVKKSLKLHDFDNRPIALHPKLAFVENSEESEAQPGCY